MFNTVKEQTLPLLVWVFLWLIELLILQLILQQLLALLSTFRILLVCCLRRHILSSVLLLFLVFDTFFMHAFWCKLELLSIHFWKVVWLLDKLMFAAKLGVVVVHVWWEASELAWCWAKWRKVGWSWRWWEAVHSLHSLALLIEAGYQVLDMHSDSPDLGVAVNHRLHYCTVFSLDEHPIVSDATAPSRCPRRAIIEEAAWCATEASCGHAVEEAYRLLEVWTLINISFLCEHRCSNFNFSIIVGSRIENALMTRSKLKSTSLSFKLAFLLAKACCRIIICFLPLRCWTTILSLFHNYWARSSWSQPSSEFLPCHATDLIDQIMWMHIISSTDGMSHQIVDIRQGEAVTFNQLHFGTWSSIWILKVIIHF